MFGAKDEQLREWVGFWVGSGLAAIEAHTRGNAATGRFCQGDELTIADICLASHVITAELFKLDLSPYPTVRRLAAEYEKIDAFVKAHPSRQPDAA